VPSPSSSYRELPPPTALSPYVSCLWVQTIGAGHGAYEQPVLPDGCADIVSANGGLTVVGPATTAVTESFAPGSVIVGVRFRTGAAPPLLGVIANELLDQEVGLADVWGPAGTRLAARCEDASGDAEGADRLRAVVGTLLDRLADAPGVDPVATRAASMLAAPGAPPVRDLAFRVGLSERQLRRRVEAAVGYPPRMLARILRFQRFLGAARSSRPPGPDLARLAVEAGYADQAHLTRDSRRLAGLPPGALLDWEARRAAPAA
jgi:AraC-like DNA-binding protein